MTGEQERTVAGRYRLRERLGAGGMGSVWLAEDMELRAQVALKEIHVPEAPGEEAGERAARARREALKAAQLREHPNVITVYDVVERNGLPWIVMEYLPGTVDLNAAVRQRGPLPPAEVARIGAAALDGLIAGHRRNIIHRDVKPSNILLAPDHSGVADRRVLLTDYGISLHSRETRLTMSGLVIGTPGYVAPERVLGAEATPASDLFSLGVTLYFAVQGVGPFDQATGEHGLNAVLDVDPTPPEQASPGLARVIMGLLAKDPPDRMRADVAAVLLAEAAEEAKRPVPPDQLPTVHAESGDKSASLHETAPPGRNGTRFRTAVLLTCAALLAGAGGGFAIGAATVHMERPHANPTVTVAPSGYPYGTQAGLSDALNPGQCVNATWPGKPFQGVPKLVVVNCDSDDPQGQVIVTVQASGASAAHTRCVAQTEKLRQTMADPVLYTLQPRAGQSDPPDTACLLFLKNATLGGSLGAYRKTGDALTTTQMGVGDCLDAKKNKDGTYDTHLASCDQPHDEQAVAWLWYGGTGSADNANLIEPCQQKYGANWARGPHQEMSSWYSSVDWDKGFRWSLCTVARSDGKKLPAGALKPAY